MTLDDLKTELQQHFQDRLVTFVGSGLSVALGLPSMGDLSRSLRAQLPGLLDIGTLAKWRVVEAELDAGADLETALGHSDDDQLNHHIRNIVAEDIGSAEASALDKIFKRTVVAPFPRLLKHLTFANNRAEVITPNYDRLIEFSTELAGFALDTTFSGSLFGALDDKASRDSLSYFVPGLRRSPMPVRKYRAHVVIYKPHGSLDWYLHEGTTPIRSAMRVDAPRLMITPGANKYKKDMRDLSIPIESGPTKQSMRLQDTSCSAMVSMIHSSSNIYGPA